MLGAYVARNLPLPEPELRPDSGRSFEWIGVPPAAIAKMAFIDAFRTAGMTRVALAARLRKSEAEARRMLNPTYATKINTLEAGLRAFITVEAA